MISTDRLYQYRDAELGALLGRTLASVEMSSEKDAIEFRMVDGGRYLMAHSQDCCESVSVEDVCGDLSDLVGSPILQAEAVTSSIDERNATAEPSEWHPDKYTDSFTWTFYKLATIKGGVTIRWFGESNGYYSERVDFVDLNDKRY